MNKKKLTTLSLGVLAVISGLSIGALATTATADNQSPKLIEQIIIEEPVLSNSISFLQAINKEEDTEDKPIQKNSYVNYSKERIGDVIKLYAILENCAFEGTQKDEFIYYLSEYVTSSVQSEKFTTKELKDQYIEFAMSFQPPHPTQEDCIESYNDAKEIVTYWNEKKNSAYNELFSHSKNRYSPDPDESVDIVSEVVEIPNKPTDNVYSLTYNSKKIPWNIANVEIFISNKENNQENSTVNTEPDDIIPDHVNNINKMAITDSNTNNLQSVEDSKTLQNNVLESDKK